MTATVAAAEGTPAGAGPPALPVTARLYVRPLDVTLAPADVVRRLAHRPRLTAWSGSWSRGALVTVDPVHVVRASTAEAMQQLARSPAVVPDPEHPAAIGGGWFGYLSFPATAPAGFPASSFGWYRDVLRHDGARWWYEALVDEDTPAGFDAPAADRRMAGLLADLRTPAPPAEARLHLQAAPEATAHLDAVERCRLAIRRGEIYQANIATHLDLRLTGSVHEAWARLVEGLAPARAGLVADPAGSAVSASPELFLHRHGRTVRTEPIKGTRPRTGAAGDEQERERLRGSEKDAAENVMIVDLMRNDLSRVCATGSVRVPRLLRIEPHPGVWHLVSTVTGELAAGRDDADLLAATFPPGSVTGTPKARAVEVIEHLEGRPRGLFTGALGYAGPLAGLELSVAIRTLEVDAGGSARLGVGGGVTVDSTPAEEWSECLDKAAPVLRCLGARPPRPPAVAGPRPDAGAGLFETLLVAAGRPLRLAEHVGRLRRSFWECYGVPLTADVATDVSAAVAGAGAGYLRVRVDAVPQAPDRVRVRVQACAPPEPVDRQAGVVLRVHPRPGGTGHELADRRDLEAIEAQLPPGEDALLVDDRNAVLETARSNVFVVRDGVVRTPPLDGHVLPGTARQAVLDRFETTGQAFEIRPVRLAELATADGAFLTNAIRGARWVRAVRGVVSWPEPHPALVRILRDCWTADPARRADDRADDKENAR